MCELEPFSVTNDANLQRHSYLLGFLILGYNQDLRTYIQ